MVSLLSSAPMLQLKYLADLLRSSSVIEEKLIFLYIRLLCEYDPDLVIGFLKSREDYSYKECLKIVTQYKHIEAISLIHEKLGSVKEAIDTIIDYLNSIKYSILKKLRERKEIANQEFYNLEHYIVIAKEICERNSPQIEDSDFDEY